MPVSYTHLSLNTFREKINILERGLDDRTIEIMKLLLFAQLNRDLDVVELLFHLSLIHICEAYDFTHLFADARPYYEAADYTTACLETTFNGPPYAGYPQFLSLIHI